MIPGFITTYKDIDGYIHLYFYPGIDKNDKSIYKDIDLSSLNTEYELKKNPDNSIDCKFLQKNIIKLHCKLLTFDNKIVYETLNIN